MGWVYLLEAKIDQGHKMTLVKIGMSNKPDFHDRVASIQREWKSARKVEVVILAIEKCQDALAIEKQLHQKFKVHSMEMVQLRQDLGGVCSGDSEWFLVPDRLIASPKGIKYEADRLSDHPNFGSSEEVPWLGLGAALIGLCFILGQCRLSAPTKISSAVIAAKGFTHANVRSSPNGLVTGNLPNGTAVTVSTRSKGWCQISKNQWIYCDLIASSLQIEVEKPTSGL